MSETNQIIQKFPRSAEFEHSEIPKIISNYTLTNQDIEELSKGEKLYIQDITAPDGTLKDASFFLYRNKEGEVCLASDYKSDQLEIPKTIFGKELSDHEIELLKSQKTIPFEHPSGDQIFLSIDEKLNKITVSNPKQIRMLHELGGYHLSEDEKLKFINGEKLPPKLFKGKNGYFTAEISLSKDKSGIVFESYTSVENKKEIIDDLRSTLNETNQINKEVIENVLQSSSQSKMELSNTSSLEQEKYFTLKTSSDPNSSILLGNSNEIQKYITSFDDSIKSISETIKSGISQEYNDRPEDQIARYTELQKFYKENPPIEISKNDLTSLLSHMESNPGKKDVWKGFNYVLNTEDISFIPQTKGQDKFELKVFNLQQLYNKHLFADKDIFNALKTGQLDQVNSIIESGKKLSPEGIKKIEESKDIKENIKMAAKPLLGLNDTKTISKIENKIHESFNKIKKAGIEKLM